jgi:dihydroxy-acid dehydratase
VTDRRDARTLRSRRWLDADDFRSFNHRSRVMQLGLEPEDWADKPVIAIVNTWSGINACHGHLRDRAEDVKRGVYQAGGLPFELPAMSLYETLMKPSPLLFRNLLAMETEELLRGYPIDGVVLMGGCDKTTPGLVLGAISAGLPAIFVPAGPMVKGNARGRTLGSGSDAFKTWEEFRAGTVGRDDLDEVVTSIARSFGTCMTMGTASTMTAIAEAIGLSLPGASSIPAVDAGHLRMCARAGRHIVDNVWADRTPQSILTRAAILNGIAVAMALGCSTNAIIHLIAIGRRAGHDVGLDDFERLSRVVPVLANVRPSGTTHLMEEFHFAGGLPALMNRIADHLDLDQPTVTGRTVGDAIAGARVHDDDVIRPLDNPVYAEGALAVLRGNLAPDGCVIKPSACDPRFLRHTGPVLVYDDYPALKADMDRPDLDITPDHIVILRNAGPQGGPGMPEWGMLPMPRRLLAEGHRDMLRLSDARMSGTSYGACILHVAPESYVGGPLALVETGDTISVDVPARTITLNVPDDELAARRARWTLPPPRFGRGYGWMFANHVGQADTGCDFDFLRTDFGPATGEPAIY